MARKKKDKVDQVLDQVMGTDEVPPMGEPVVTEEATGSSLAAQDVTESPIAMSESSDYDHAVHAEPSPEDDAGAFLAEELADPEKDPEFEAYQANGLDDSPSKDFGIDTDYAEPKQEAVDAFVAGNLQVSVAKANAPVADTSLIWKGKKAEPDLENFLREKAHQFMTHYYGRTLTLNQVDQAVLDQCASDYRFMREIDRLTRNNS